MVRLYFKHLLKAIKCELEFKTQFIINFIAQNIYFASTYFMIIALFGRFDSVKGFGVYEVLLCFGIIFLGFSVNEMFFRGLDRFEDLIMDGSLDRLLLRPYPILVQVLWHKMDLVKIVRLIQSAIIIVIALVNMNIVWSFDKVLVLIFMILSAILLFFSIFVIMASYCFITVQGLEVKNVFTDGSKFIAQYPIGIFNGIIKKVFTFVLPFAAVNYYPLLYLIGKSNNLLYLLSPLVSFLYLGVSIIIFNRGLRKYSGTGS